MGGKRKISLEVVKRLTPGETIWDTDVMGFAVRCQREAKTYCLKYRVGGRQRWYTIGRHGAPWTPEKARTEALRLLGLVAAGKDPAKDKAAGREARTVKQLGEKFLEEHAEAKRKTRTADDYRDLLERLVFPAIGPRRAKDITRADVRKLHNDLRETPYQANKVLAVLSKMFNMAEAWGERPDGSNPCRHVEKFREARRERMLSAKELSALGAALYDFERRWAEAERIESDLTEAKALGDKERISALRLELKSIGRTVTPAAIAAVRLLVFTGARLSEILTLEWAWVNTKKGEARLPDSKTGAKNLQLPPPALAVLESLPRVKGNPYVIVGAKPEAHLVNLQKPWREIRKQAKLPDLRIHDLRHAFASVAASSGMALPIIGKMLGHTQPATTQRYAHLQDDPVKAAAASVANQISADMDAKPAAEIINLEEQRK